MRQLERRRPAAPGAHRAGERGLAVAGVRVSAQTGYRLCLIKTSGPMPAERRLDEMGVDRDVLDAFGDGEDAADSKKVG